MSETTSERQLAAYYDQDAPDRAARALEPARVGARNDFFELIPPGAARLLEIGTGTGRDSTAFVGDGLDVYGIDLSFEQARRAAACGVRQCVASVRRLPFASETFPVVWTMSVLMHIPDSDIDSVLAEIRRVLQPGGLAAIGVWGGPDVEQPRAQDPYRPARLFSRRSDHRWQRLISQVGTIEEFRTWPTETDAGWWYQYAVVRRTL